jgi:CMP-N-acetylneuraminic acid synthetase
MNIVAMIPARMGSQRLAKKNLALLDGVPLISRAVDKCVASSCFSEVWVNSEDEAFAPYAKSGGAQFHLRPAELGDNAATSEQFVAEFLHHHQCDYLVQVHSIAPLIKRSEIKRFVEFTISNECDSVFSVVDENLECIFQGEPVNFTFDVKQNSQDLLPVRRIVWSVTAWRRSTFLAALAEGKCATFAGRIGLFPVGRMAGHVIKTQDDLDIAAALWPYAVADDG